MQQGVDISGTVRTGRHVRIRPGRAICIHAHAHAESIVQGQRTAMKIHVCGLAKSTPPMLKAEGCLTWKRENGEVDAWACMGIGCMGMASQHVRTHLEELQFEYEGAASGDLGGRATVTVRQFRRNGQLPLVTLKYQTQP